MPPWAWFAGVVGVVYVIITMLVIPQLGATTFIAVVVAGQMTMATIIDHYGFLGLPHRPIDLIKFIGVLLVVSGVLVIQFKTSN